MTTIQTHSLLEREIGLAHIDTAVALLVALALLPVWIFNAVLAIVRSAPIAIAHTQLDALDRPVTLLTFSCGWLRESLHLLAVVKGRLALLGVSLQHRLDSRFHVEFNHLPAGLFSVFDMHSRVGLIEQPHENLLRAQTRLGFGLSYFRTIVKALLCNLLYAHANRSECDHFNLFGITISNTRLDQALNWIAPAAPWSGCRIGFFLNVNSINLALKNPQLMTDLRSSDCVFADGSGIRLAASHVGVRLRANLNGTDLLPHICRMAINRDRSLFLLGSAPGVAQKAAQNLQSTFPGLRIAGYQHGYFKQADSASIIDAINASGADICLVAMGSPLQENWLTQHAHQLCCSTALAVGGLLDFYSGRIPRAPLWLRELGMEWVWRLLQEPKSKFNRYIIGNPLFLFRTFVLNQARS